MSRGNHPRTGRADPGTVRGTTGASRWARTRRRAGCPPTLYGNILILAALVPFQEDTDVRHAMIVVIGTALSTFIAHAFSEFLGGDGSVHPRALLRESLPILTTALVPLLLLLISRVGRLEAGTAVLVAELVIIGRIASTGMVAARLRDEKSRLRVLLSGVLVAGTALLIVVLKVALTH